MAAVDPTIFTKIKEMLMRDYNETTDEANCMVNQITEQKVVDRFYSANLITDDNQLKVNLHPFLADLVEACKPSKDEPSGEWVGWIIGPLAVIAVVLFIGLIVRFVRNKQTRQSVTVPDDLQME